MKGSVKTTAKYSSIRSGTKAHYDNTYHDEHPLHLKIEARSEKEAKYIYKQQAIDTCTKNSSKQNNATFGNLDDGIDPKWKKRTD